MKSKKRKPPVYDLNVKALSKKKEDFPIEDFNAQDNIYNTEGVINTVLYRPPKRKDGTSDKDTKSHTLKVIKGIVDSKRYTFEWRARVSEAREAALLRTKKLSDNIASGTDFKLLTPMPFESKPLVTEKGSSLQHGSPECTSENCSTPSYYTKDTVDKNNHKVKENIYPVLQADRLITEDFRVDHVTYPHSGTTFGRVPGLPSRTCDVAKIQDLPCSINSYSEHALTTSDTELESYCAGNPKQETNIIVTSGIIMDEKPKKVHCSVSDKVEYGSDVCRLHLNNLMPLIDPTRTASAHTGALDAHLEVLSDCVNESLTRPDFMAPNPHQGAVEDINAISQQHDESRINIRDGLDWNVTPSRVQETVFSRRLQKDQKIDEEYIIGLSENNSDKTEIQEDRENSSSCTDCSSKEVFSEALGNKNLNALPSLNCDAAAYAMASGNFSGKRPHFPCSRQDPCEDKNFSAYSQRQGKASC